MNSVERTKRISMESWNHNIHLGSQMKRVLPQIGATETCVERLCENALRRLSNCLSGGFRDIEKDDAQVLPSTSHWIFHLDADTLNADDRFDACGPDGVPVVFPGRRRMWAGGSIDFLSPLRIGTNVSKSVRVVDVSEKTNDRMGKMVFVKRESVLRDDDERVCVVDTTDHVYIDESKTYDPPENPVRRCPEDFEWSRVHRADPVSLFRFSALTRNSHRIHYDLKHATRVEGYPDLVVHGPMLAMLMLESYQQRVLSALPVNGDRAEAFAGYRYTYRGLQPAFVDRAFHVAGRRLKSTENNSAAEGYEDTELVTLNDANQVCMRAVVTHL